MITLLSKLTPRRILARWVRPFGLVLIPISEIERMERDAEGDYAAVNRQRSERDKGYFNGLADCSSKEAARLRMLYLPNTP